MRPLCEIMEGDCLGRLRSLASDSLDSLVTDPPAGIAFMGKDWDKDKGGRDAWVAWMTEVMRECLRVLKPGAHGLVWALPRTSHWTATALEDAGFEIRDVVTHLFGTGFPKSLDVSKAIDKAAGKSRQVVGYYSSPEGTSGRSDGSGSQFGIGGLNPITAPATDSARQWQGWGTALKPASEHWILVRKPCSEKTVAANVLKWGTGAINVDGCRIGAHSYTPEQWAQKGLARTTGNAYGKHEGSATELPTGRFPANLVLDEEAAAMLDEQSGHLHGAGTFRHGSGALFGSAKGEDKSAQRPAIDSGGGASRFFYVAKASRSDRGSENTHPTVKSTKLMSYLIRLVTPPGGIVLDPFMGSGSTGVAAKAEGMGFLGIEKEAEYAAIAKARLGA